MNTNAAFIRLAHERLAKSKTGAIAGIMSGLFGQQIELINHPSKRKAACCSRRAGKSVTAAAYLIKTMIENPESINVYLALTRKSAKRILWPVLKRLDKKHSIGLKFLEAELIVEHPNGSQVVLMGANDEGTAENLRGSPYHLVVLDEIASFRGHIDSMIEEIIEPALSDYDGTLMLIGTPTADFNSIFFNATNGKVTGEDLDDEKGGTEWAAFNWTMFDNPYLKDPHGYVAKLKKRKKWADDNPILLREYYGKWAKSSDELVYRFSPLRNVYASLGQVTEYVLGVDLGFNDSAAFVVWGYDRTRPDLYLVHAHKQSGMLPSQIAEYIQGLRDTFDFTSMVVDEGGLGKSIAEEYRIRYSIPIKAAEKTQKRVFIDLMNSDLVDGKVKVPEYAHETSENTHPLAVEWSELLWDRSRKLENPTCENHLADAALYAWRECRHFLFEAEAPAIERNSTAHWKQQEDQFRESIQDSIAKSDSTNWWEN